MKVNTHSGGKIQENAYVVSARIWHCQIERAVAVKIASSEEQRPDADPIILRRAETPVSTTEEYGNVIVIFICHNKVKDTVQVEISTYHALRPVARYIMLGCAKSAIPDTQKDCDIVR